jgi:hypothetical protein
MQEANTVEQNYICQKCDLLMVKKDTGFTYLGNTFRASVLRCPTCGIVYIPEKLARGRIKEVEMMMEEK